MPQDPTLTQNGSLTVTIKAETVHAAYAKLYILPPGANDWQNEREVADGSTDIPTSTVYDVQHGTYLGWNLTVGTKAGVTDYLITFTLEQGGHVIDHGRIPIEGTTDASGVDVDLDHVLLR
jgi:hypothetical protein